MPWVETEKIVNWESKRGYLCKGNGWRGTEAKKDKGGKGLYISTGAISYETCRGSGVINFSVCEWSSEAKGWGHKF